MRPLIRTSQNTLVPEPRTGAAAAAVSRATALVEELSQRPYTPPRPWQSFASAAAEAATLDVARADAGEVAAAEADAFLARAELSLTRRIRIGRAHV